MSFKNILGQHKAKEIISKQLLHGKIPHAYLFIGPDGVGRKKTAIETAKALNCLSPENFQACDKCISCEKTVKFNHPDIQLIDFQYQAYLENKDLDKQKNIKIDTIRALQKEVNLKPVESKWKIFIIEPAEKITIEAANSLLKTLEEPPSWTLIILIAKHKENLPATIVSRTQIVPFSPLSEDEIVKYLTTVISTHPDDAKNIAKVCEGSISKAVELVKNRNTEVFQIWENIFLNKLKTADALVVSQEYAKNANDFLDELLNHAKVSFRENPQRLTKTIEMIIASRNLLEKNVNPQMILDDLLININTVN